LLNAILEHRLFVTVIVEVAVVIRITVIAVKVIFSAGCWRRQGRSNRAWCSHQTRNRRRWLC
jgi:hypothetical protein